MIDRRTLLRTGFLTTVGALTTAAAEAATTMSVSLSPRASGPLVPHDFLGLSYETQQLETSDFFTARNRPLVQAFRDLASNGILRIGGNTSEFSWWKQFTGDAPAPRVTRPVVAGQARPDTSYAVTPSAIDALAKFLDATGWRCIYGLNLGTGRPADLAREAGYVQKRLGKRLLAFAIGNEVDVFQFHLRDPAKWNVDTFLAEWFAAAQAIMAVTPHARFVLPEAAVRVNWLAEIAKRWPAFSNTPPIESLSHHFYVGGPPSITPERLLRPTKMVAANAEIARGAARDMNVLYRVTETNSCFHGGKPGVSDSYVAALWAADYSLSLMSLGYAGVNFHGGEGAAVANSVGGLPGEKLLPDAQLRPRPFYTPIGNIDGRTTAQPVYRGMKFAGLFAGSRMRPVSITDHGLNVTAYAADSAAGTLLAIINKEVATRVAVPLGRHQVVARLSGSSLGSREARLTLTPASHSTGNLGIAPLSAVIVKLAARG